VRIENRPNWNSSFAEQLDAFLATPAGQALLGTLQADALEILLSPASSASAVELARALNITVNGLEAMSDVGYWTELEKPMTEPPDKAFRYFTDNAE
jgi:hypothetical protein